MARTKASAYPASSYGQICELVRTMKCRMFPALIATVSVAFAFSSSNTFGGSVAGHARTSHPSHLTPHHQSPARSLLHQKQRNFGAFWPASGDYLCEPNGGPEEPISGDIHYTYTYDVPWDAVHRYPQVVTPTVPVVRPYVPGCPAQSVTVPMGDGKEETISIVRCY